MEQSLLRQCCLAEQGKEEQTVSVPAITRQPQHVLYNLYKLMRTSQRQSHLLYIQHVAYDPFSYTFCIMYKTFIIVTFICKSLLVFVFFFNGTKKDTAELSNWESGESNGVTLNAAYGPRWQMYVDRVYLAYLCMYSTSKLTIKALCFDYRWMWLTITTVTKLLASFIFLISVNAMCEIHVYSVSAISLCNNVHVIFFCFFQLSFMK